MKDRSKVDGGNAQIYQIIQTVNHPAQVPAEKSRPSEVVFWQGIPGLMQAHRAGRFVHGAAFLLSGQTGRGQSGKKPDHVPNPAARHAGW
jgi:hypothetical protein